MSDAATLPVRLKGLRLPTFTRQWKPLAELAESQGWSVTRYLAQLCELETAERQTRRIQRLTHQSQLPAGKTLSSFEFKHARALERRRIEALASDGEWVRQAHNVILFGPSGVGKTHLAAAIGHGLTEQGISVRYLSATTLVQQLQLARRELRLPDALNKLDKYAVLVIDDLGYVKKTEQETSVLFELIAHRYESASIIVTANQPFSEWDQVFSDTMMTVAAVDRLVHHATIVELTNESYRKRAATKGSPLVASPKE